MSKRTYNPVQHLLPEIKEPSPNLVKNWSDTADAAPFRSIQYFSTGVFLYCPYNLGQAPLKEALFLRFATDSHVKWSMYFFRPIWSAR